MIDCEIVTPARHPGAAQAARLEQLAVHVDQVARAGALVQVVDVLGDDEHRVRPAPFQLGERKLRRVGLDRRVEQLPAGARRRSAGPAPGRARTPPGSRRPPGASPATGRPRRGSSAGPNSTEIPAPVSTTIGPRTPARSPPRCAFASLPGRPASSRHRGTHGAPRPAPASQKCRCRVPSRLRREWHADPDGPAGLAGPTRPSQDRIILIDPLSTDPQHVRLELILCAAVARIAGTYRTKREHDGPRRRTVADVTDQLGAEIGAANGPLRRRRTRCPGPRCRRRPPSAPGCRGAGAHRRWSRRDPARRPGPRASRSPRR